MNRSKDWLESAKNDLEHARKSVELGHYNWACFAAQQAAEKAAKALHMRCNQIAWGHSVLQLLRELPAEHQAPEELLDRARVLDRHYIPSRYPNAHPSGASHEYYIREDAEKAVRYAEEVLRFCAGEGLED